MPIATNGLPVGQSFAAALVDDLPMADIHLVLVVFAQDLDRLTAILADAGRERDIAAFHRAAHALSGAAAAVGATGLARGCRDAERSALDFRSMQDELRRVLQDAGQVRAELDRVLAWLASSDALERDTGASG